jgi:hypothetical protein
MGAAHTAVLREANTTVRSEIRCLNLVDGGLHQAPELLQAQPQKFLAYCRHGAFEAAFELETKIV